MRKIILPAALALCAPVAAEAALLTFEGEQFSTLGAEIAPEYGDSDVVDVDSGTRTGFGDKARTSAPLWYYDQASGNGYGAGAPSGVAIFPVNGLVGEFSFTPDPGYAVTLNSFDIASYPNGQPVYSYFAVFDGDFDVLWTAQGWVGGSVATLSPGVTSHGPLYLQWGYDWDVGLDNIDFTAAPAAPVPAPAALPLLGAAMAGLAALRWRRGRGARAA